MKKICDNCKYQEVADAYIGGIGCAKTTVGAICIHDITLKDFYEPRTNSDISVRNQAAQIKNQSEELSKLRNTVAIL